MDKSVKVGLAASALFVGLSYLGSSSAGVTLWRVLPASTPPGVEQAVVVVSTGHSQHLSAWIDEKLKKGLVVVGSLSGIEERSMLFAMTREEARKIEADGYFRIIAGSAS